MSFSAQQDLARLGHPQLKPDFLHLQELLSRKVLVKYRDPRKYDGRELRRREEKMTR